MLGSYLQAHAVDDGGCRNHRRSQEFVLGADSRGAEIETPKASRGEGNGEEVSPSPADYGIWGRVVSSSGRKRGLEYLDFRA